MSMYTSLDQLPDSLEDGRGLAWQFEPGRNVDQAGIRLNQPRLLAVARMAGLGGLVVRDYQGEQTRYNTESAHVSGLNSDGSAVGDASLSVAKAKTERSSLSDQPDIRSMCDWPVATVELNRTELGSRVSNRIHTGEDSDRAWATEINHSLKRGVIGAAYQKLARDYKSKRDTEPLLTHIFAGTLAFEGLRSQWLLADIVFVGMHAIATAMAMTYNLRATGNHHMQHKRYSLFPNAFQPDRLALAGAMLYTRRLVIYDSSGKH